MKIAKTRSAALLGLLSGLCLTFSANAASTWTFGGISSGNATTSYANSTDGNLAISGAYAANGASNTGFATTSTKWVTDSAATPLYYGGNGLGMGSDGTGTPNHAIDNVGVNTESILLSFTNSVSLSSIGIGYVNTDSDISLFRYTGTSAPVLNTTGASLAAMVAAGWELVGNYGDLVVGTSNPYNLVNSSNKGSSWWLISAYNSSYGAATTGWVDQGSDYFKIYAVAAGKCTTVNSSGVCNGNTAKVPEPGSLALASLAIFGVIYTRRQTQQKKG